MPDKEYFRPDEAAKLLGVHRGTIYRWIKEDRLETIKTIGGHNRIHRNAIKKIMTCRNV